MLYALCSLLNEMFEHPDFFVGQRAIPAAWKVLFRQAGIIDAVQFNHFILEMRKNAAYNMIFAGVKFDLYFALGKSFHEVKAICFDRTVFEFNPFADLFQVLKRKIPV